MGTVIVMASSKGGVGKTTSTTALAVNLAASGFTVSVVDADRNQAFATWHQGSENPEMSCSSCIDHNEIVGHVMGKADESDVCIVDTAGFENQTAIFAMGAADIVLIPCMPDRNSVLEARKTAKQVQSVGQLSRRSIPLRLLLTRWEPRGLSERATLEDIEAASLPKLQQHLSNLVAYQKASFSGEMPKTGTVGHQVDRLIAELQELEAVPSKPAKERAHV
jgi:chromosome partitioning protein